MNVRPDLVASVTTMHTPHKGSPIADVATGVLPDDSVQGDLGKAVANAVGDLVNLLSGNRGDKSDIDAMLGEFTADGAAAFNARFPAGVPETAWVEA